MKLWKYLWKELKTIVISVKKSNHLSIYLLNIVSVSTNTIILTNTIIIWGPHHVCPSCETQSAPLKPPPPPRMNPDSEKNGGEWTWIVIGRRLFWRHRIDCQISRAAAAVAVADVADDGGGPSCDADAEVAAICKRQLLVLNLWDKRGGFREKMLRGDRIVSKTGFLSILILKGVFIKI